MRLLSLVRTHPLDRVAGKGTRKSTPTFRGFLWCGYGDEVGRDADVPVALCSQEVRATIFFVSNVSVGMFFLSCVMLA